MKRLVIPAVIVGAAMAMTPAASAADDTELVTYRVTIENTTTGQPLSFAVAATHRRTTHLFEVGALASAELEALAEDGGTAPMQSRLASNAATEVVRLVPLIPKGTAAPNFPFPLFDELEFDIQARPGDRFSWASMLVCTNDGVTGLDAVPLPKRGTAVYFTQFYDAGTEDNTELSEDIVDPCSFLDVPDFDGEIVADGFNGGVDTDPREPIGLHPGIIGHGDLNPAIYGWGDEPAAKVTIRLVG